MTRHRMNWAPYRWLITYLHACSICHAYGERAWPGAVRFVWPIARANVDREFPRTADEAERDHG